MPDPIVLYSTVTKLAFNIARRYYHDIHYVWCAPIFDASKESDVDFIVPPTSSPYEIYRDFQKHVNRAEGHSHMIEENKAGILRGATAKRRAGIITPEQEQDIIATAEDAQHIWYEPLILVVPFAKVKKLISIPPVTMRASALSAEVIIPELPRRLFDVIRP